MKKTMIAAACIGMITLTAFITAPQKENKSLPAPALQESTKWSIDKVHTSVRFAVSHLVVAETEGTFKIFDGSVEHSKADWSDAKINFSIDVNSINTDNNYRDKHLKSDDFFNAEKYPAMTFQSTSFKPLGNNKYELYGNLTIRDVTKPVKFDVSFGGLSANKQKAGFKATGSINRFDYNLKWDKMTEANELVVGKEVEIAVKVELDRQK